MTGASATLGQRVRRALPEGIIALVMVLGGVSHLTAPQQFAPLVPRMIPAMPALYASGVVELAIGIAVLWPRTRRYAGLAFALLCVGYLPLHLWDFVRPDPVFAPPVAASVRLVVQLVFIALGAAVWRRRA